jgi:6-phosphofructokinase 1
VAHLAAKIKDGVKRGLIIRNKFANENYTSDFIHRLYNEEGRGVFTCRLNVLGHVQQGGRPSPFDRNLGSRMAIRCAQKLIEQIQANKTEQGVFTNNPDTATLLGLLKQKSVFTSIVELKDKADFEHRIPKENWWLKLRPLLRILAKHDSMYQTEGVEEQFDEYTSVDKDKLIV